MKVETVAFHGVLSNSKHRSPGVSAGDSGFMESATRAMALKTAPQSSVYSSQGEEDSKLSYREFLLGKARESDSVAEQLLGFNIDEGVGLTSGLIDITHAPIITYSISGELVTDESKAYFSEVSEYAVKNRLDILWAGRDAGSSAAEILEKIIDFNATLPSRYKDMANIQF